MTRAGRGCNEARAWLAAHALDDLTSLERAWIDAHLSRCEECEAVRARLDHGFVAAKAPLPEVDVEHLVTLVRAAAPGELGAGVTQARRRVSPVVMWGGPSVLAVAAAVALFVVVAEPDDVTPASPPPSTVEALAAPAAAKAGVPAPGPSYLAPTPYVRMITAAGWVGRTVVSGARVDVEMSEGEAAFALDGGAGRTLRIATPRAVVDVIGTRFSVRVGARDVAVAVAEGKVAVRARAAGASDGGQGVTLMEHVSAGELLTVDDDGMRRVRWEGPALLADSFLAAPAPERELAPVPQVDAPTRIAAEHRKKPARRRTVRRAGLDELLPRLEEAERHGRRGDRAGALARYEALEEDPRFSAHRALIDYDRARLQGLVFGDLEGASRTLARIERSASGPLAIEAALTRCELGRQKDPCGAVACLDRLIASGGDAADDARRLRVRWRAACEP